jgi:hypothetical protein
MTLPRSAQDLPHGGHALLGARSTILRSAARLYGADLAPNTTTIAVKAVA